MNNTYKNGRFDQFVALGTAGSAANVDLLMAALAGRDDIATTRLVDYALSLVKTPEGTARLRHYLFQGTQRQRNYAALYFKRRGEFGLLGEALAQGKVDALQVHGR
jgi:HEAT repeat protein